MDPNCAILADRNLGFAEGVRGLLESAYQRVYVVGDIESLVEGARRLEPSLVVMDLNMVGQSLQALLADIRRSSPGSHVIVLTLHDQASVVRSVIDAGVDGVVLKRRVGDDLLAAVDAIDLGRQFVSSGFEKDRPPAS